MNALASQTNLSAIERLQLIQTLSELPLTQLGQLEFALQVPNAVMPSMAAPVGDRAKAMLDWAEGPTGPGLNLVRELVQMIIPGHHGTHQSNPTEQPTAVTLVMTVDGDTNELTMETLLRLLQEIHRISGEEDLEIERIEEGGGIRFILNGTPSSLNHMRLLHQVGLLPQLLNRSVFSVQFESRSQSGER